MADYIYGGVSYIMDSNETIFSARVVEKEESTEYGELGAVTRSVKSLVPVEPYKQTPAAQVPMRVIRILRELAEEEAEEAAKQEAQRIQRLAQQEADMMERLGKGAYQCPMCDHRQHSSGVCEYCGDAFVE